MSKSRHAIFRRASIPVLAAIVQVARADLPEVVVVGQAPLPGTGIAIDKVPGNVQTLGGDDLDPDHGSTIIPLAAARRLTSVSLTEEQGSQYQPDFVFRGFEASPISGVAEGLAVYQDGTRLNEALGDSVNWDLVPQFAVRRMTVESNNTVFGLNALGGAVTLQMKNGFNSPGADLELSGGRFGNVTGYGAYGVNDGTLGFFGAVGGVTDDGFREVSPTRLRQGFADFGYESGPVRLHLSVTAADNAIAAVGPTPVQMLAADPRSVFTFPQSMHNRMQMVQLTGQYQLTDTLQLSADVYHRHFGQQLLDGNTTDVQPCGNNDGFFCLEGANQYPADLLYDSGGNPVPTSVLADGATPGEIDHTRTATQTTGGTLQATLTAPLAGHDNHLTVGAAFDDSSTRYSAYGELGSIGPNLFVAGSGVIIDQGQSDTASPPIEEPVSVQPTTRYTGVYAVDAFDITGRLTGTLSVRYNHADIDLRDLLGTALNASHGYGRLNPGLGLTFRLSGSMTAYAGYSQSNRAPTAAELSCANPQSPCLLDAFLVSDPALKQVVSRTVEFGLRGALTGEGLPGSVKWNLGAFRTRNSDDIILLATAINGFGYFANAGATLRQGLEAGISWKLPQWALNLSYSLVQATYRDSLTLSSNSPAADANGNIQVHPGDRIPLNPENRLTAEVEYSPTPQLDVGVDTRFSSSQFLAGDNSNQEPPLPSWTVVDAHAGFRLSPSLQLFAGVDNLFDRTYYTYGAFAQLDGLPPNFDLTDPRTLSPSPPRTWFAGVKITW
ncbi:MAG TPA: TonB-dependent receptor [Steroidobacteraceae bacterium]|nr:TonB-dependent receptor [Steroidobacteraceae bacterium]